MMSNNTIPTMFINYAHYGEDWKDNFVLNLRTLDQQDKIQIVIWDENKINTGDKWYPDIKQAMSQAVAAVCVISLYFLASDFIIEKRSPPVEAL